MARKDAFTPKIPKGKDTNIFQIIEIKLQTFFRNMGKM
jgi:hypothetical protein